MVLPCLFSFQTMDTREQISWLDYTILNNPQGVMKVLSDYGYNGHLQPQSYDELKICALEVIDRHGDQGTVDLLKAHPEYLVFKDILLQIPTSFRNAVGTFTEKLNEFMQKNPINKALVALTVFAIAYFIITKISKNENSSGK